VLGTNFSGWDQHELKIEPGLMRCFTDNAKRLLRADAGSVS
jgi:hypothetical protein